MVIPKPSSIIVYRACGDKLSLRFAKNGSLSSAYLFSENKQEDCTRLLPGLNRDNALEYVSFLGFHESINVVLLEACKRGSIYLRGKEFVESVLVKNRQYIVQVSEPSHLGRLWPRHKNFRKISV